MVKGGALSLQCGTNFSTVKTFDALERTRYRIASRPDMVLRTAVLTVKVSEYARR
jgi:hypothetical protein